MLGHRDGYGGVFFFCGGWKGEHGKEDRERERERFHARPRDAGINSHLSHGDKNRESRAFPNGEDDGEESRNSAASSSIRLIKRRFCIDRRRISDEETREVRSDPPPPLRPSYSLLPLPREAKIASLHPRPADYFRGDKQGRSADWIPSRTGGNNNASTTANRRPRARNRSGLRSARMVAVEPRRSRRRGRRAECPVVRAPEVERL